MFNFKFLDRIFKIINPVPTFDNMYNFLIYIK